MNLPIPDMSLARASTQLCPITRAGSLPECRRVISTSLHEAGSVSSCAENCIWSLASIESLHGSA